MKNLPKYRLTRRSFIKGLAKGAAGAGLTAGFLEGCDPGEFSDYMFLNEDDKVTDYLRLVS